jgi:hypothetical protein
MKVIPINASLLYPLAHTLPLLFFLTPRELAQFKRNVAHSIDRVLNVFNAEGVRVVVMSKIS